LLFLKATSRCRSLEKVELLSQTLTSRRLWIESWKLAKICVRLCCNFWYSSTLLNCSESKF
jgi:hypothetical protein